MNINKITNYITSDIKLYLKVCLLNLITDITIYEEPIPKPASYTALKEQVMAKMPVFAELLKNSDSHRDDFIKSLIELKKQALETAKSAYLADNFHTMANNIIEDELRAREFAAIPSSLTYKDVEDLLCKKILTIKDDYKLSVALREIMGALPCALTKHNFEDYVKESFAKEFVPDASKSQAEFLVNKISSEILPFTFDELSQAFPELFALYNKTVENKLSDMPEDELKSLNDDVCSSYSLIAEYTDYISSLYNDINYMLILSLYGYDIDFSTEGDLILKDLFFSSIKYASLRPIDEAEADIKDGIYNEAADKLDKSLEKYSEDKVTSHIKVILSAIQSNEQIMHLYKIYTSITNLYYEEAENAVLCLGTEKDQTIALNNENFIAQLVEKFENSINAFTPYTKKRLRQRLISNIYCPYSPGEVVDYVVSMAERADSKSVNSIYAAVLDVVENMENFEKYADYAGYHSHGQSCSCGDDRHHDSSCSCGGDHSHFHKHL